MLLICTCTCTCRSTVDLTYIWVVKWTGHCEWPGGQVTSLRASWGVSELRVQPALVRSIEGVWRFCPDGDIRSLVPAAGVLLYQLQLLCRHRGERIYRWKVTKFFWLFIGGTSIFGHILRALQFRLGTDGALDWASCTPTLGFYLPFSSNHAWEGKIVPNVLRRRFCDFSWLKLHLATPDFRDPSRSR